MSNAIPIKLFPVDDLKSMSFKSGNDILIIFEMPESSYQRPIGKNKISLLFRPSVIRGPWSATERNEFAEFLTLENAEEKPSLKVKSRFLVKNESKFQKTAFLVIDSQI